MHRFSNRSLRIFILLAALVVAAREVPELAALADDVSNDGTVVSIWQEHVPTAVPDYSSPGGTLSSITQLYNASYNLSSELVILGITHSKSSGDLLSLTACRRE